VASEIRGKVPGEKPSGTRMWLKQTLQDHHGHMPMPMRFAAEVGSIPVQTLVWHLTQDAGW
jgi:hypothetical protein